MIVETQPVTTTCQRPADPTCLPDTSHPSTKLHRGWFQTRPRQVHIPQEGRLLRHGTKVTGLGKSRPLIMKERQADG
jgi:hypothetical protein